ncbi:3825_t:CDS:1, partial [Scutellospora calospora]
MSYNQKSPINLSTHLYKRQDFSNLTNNNTSIIVIILAVAVILGLLIFVILYQRKRNRNRIFDSRLKPLQLVQNKPLLNHKTHNISKKDNLIKKNRHSLPSTKSTITADIRTFEVRLSMPVELAKPIREYYQTESKV